MPHNLTRIGHPLLLIIVENFSSMNVTKYDIAFVLLPAKASLPEEPSQIIIKEKTITPRFYFYRFFSLPPADQNLLQKYHKTPINPQRQALILLRSFRFFCGLRPVQTGSRVKYWPHIIVRALNKFGFSFVGQYKND